MCFPEGKRVTDTLVVRMVVRTTKTIGACHTQGIDEVLSKSKQKARCIMGKKITVITGSPRKKGNSFALAHAFIEEARDGGCEVECFDAADLMVGGCRACGACFSKGDPCVFDDDFNAIARSIQEADVVVFASPLYWYSFTAQIKPVIDRLYSFFASDTDVSGKDYILLCCCEEEDVAAMDGVRIPLEKSAALLKWANGGMVLVPGVAEIGDIDKTDALNQARELARKF